MKNLKTIKLLSIIAIISLVSCGGDDNKVNTRNGSTTQFFSSNNSTVGHGNLQGPISQLASELSSSLQCPSGRLNTYQQFYLQAQNGNINHTKVCGNFQPGILPGNVGLNYVGVSPTRDFMIVSEVTSGSQVIGHNIIVSMCSYYTNYYNYQIPIVANERQLSHFRTSCIYLDKDNFCAHGAIERANTSMVSAAYQFKINGIAVNLNPVNITTDFTIDFTTNNFAKPKCYGSF